MVPPFILGIIVGIVLFLIYNMFFTVRCEAFEGEPQEVQENFQTKIKSIVEGMAVKLKEAKDEGKSKNDMIKISNEFFDSMNRIQKSFAAWKINTEE